MSHINTKLKCHIYNSLFQRKDSYKNKRLDIECYIMVHEWQFLGAINTMTYPYYTMHQLPHTNNQTPNVEP